MTLPPCFIFAENVIHSMLNVLYIKELTNGSGTADSEIENKGKNVVIFMGSQVCVSALKTSFLYWYSTFGWISGGGPNRCKQTYSASYQTWAQNPFITVYSVILKYKN